jgi:hypothetical protein
MLIEIAHIRTDGGTQSRSTLNQEVVERYADNMQAGDTFPPVIVMYDGSSYWLADGFHRLAAAKRLLLTMIAADVRPGQRRDAVFFGFGANRMHGLNLTNEDKRRAARALLEDREWGKMSNREIARHVGCTHTFVAKIREQVMQQVAKTAESEQSESGNGYHPHAFHSGDIVTTRTNHIALVVAVAFSNVMCQSIYGDQVVQRLHRASQLVWVPEQEFKSLDAVQRAELEALNSHELRSYFETVPFPSDAPPEAEAEVTLLPPDEPLSAPVTTPENDALAEPADIPNSGDADDSLLIWDDAIYYDGEMPSFSPYHKTVRFNVSNEMYRWMHKGGLKHRQLFRATLERVPGVVGDPFVSKEKAS